MIAISGVLSGLYCRVRLREPAAGVNDGRIRSIRHSPDQPYPATLQAWGIRKSIVVERFGCSAVEVIVLLPNPVLRQDDILYCP